MHINSRYTTDLYFEAHVTIEPVFENDLDRARSIGQKFGFRVADLLMKKRNEDTEVRSKNDTFLTGHGKEYMDLLFRMQGVIVALKNEGFKVWRYKIENTLIDSRNNDELEILNHDCN